MQRLTTLSPLALVAATLALGHGASAQVWESNLGTPQMMDANGIGDEGLVTLALGFNFPLPGGVGTTNSVQVCPNGYIWLNGISSVSDYSESVLEMLTEQPRILAHWDDLECVYGSFSGDIWLNTFPASGGTPARAVITWKVTEYADAVNNCTMQVQMYSDGSFSIYYEDAGRDGIVGVTPGNGANDPGESNLSAGVVNGGSTVYENFADAAAGASDLQDTLLVFTPNAQNGYDVTSAVVPITLASATSRGQGCPAAREAMIYEYFTSANRWDLTGQSVRYTWLGDRYVATSVPYTWESNVTSPVTNWAVGDGDDGHSAPLALGFTSSVWGGSVNDVLINTNGRVHFDTATTVTELPLRTSAAISGFLDFGPVLSVAGVDFDSTIGGTIYFDTFASPPRAVVTWQNVPRWNTPAETGTVQAQIFPNGDLLVSWQAFSITQDGNTGLFLGNGAPAQGAIDYTNALPVVALLNGTDLRLSSTAPAIGTTAALTANNIAPGTLGTVALFGFPVTIPLDMFGMPGCTAYDLGELYTLPMIPSGSTAATSLPVPNAANLQGIGFTVQAYSVAPGINALGIHSSNGVDMVVGY